MTMINTEKFENKVHPCKLGYRVDLPVKYNVFFIKFHEYIDLPLLKF